MKSSSHIYLLLLLAMTLVTGTSCKKLQGEGRTVVEGQAVDKYTGAPVPYATLVIRSQPDGSSGFNTIELERQADAQGKFDFSFEASSNKTYSLGGGLEQRYYSSTDFIYIDNASRNRDLKLKMKPFAWAKIKFINESPYDTAWFYVTGTYLHDDNRGQSYFNLSQQYRDTTVIRSLEGGIEGEIIYRITKGGVANRIIVPFKAKPLDTTTFEIRY